MGGGLDPRRRAAGAEARAPLASGAGERRFLIVAGEPSGDQHAARLVAALRRLGPCRIAGVAGPDLRAAGVEPLARMEDLALLGFTGIVARLPELLRVRARLIAALREFQPHAVVLVDYPGFNLRLGPRLRRAGARLFYYIAPQVWAWHPKRARAMAGWVDRLAVVFPFEEPIFRAAGVTVRFVGHPMIDGLAPEVDEARFRAEIAAGANHRILGLLPGSRAQELERHLAPMVEAARQLMRERRDLVGVLPLAGALAEERLGEFDLEGIRVVRGRVHAVQAYATACAVASGTATLETAIFGTPLAIVYRTGRLNYAIARRVVRLPRIGLPNIVAGEEVAPELIQDALTPERLAATLAPWLDDPGVRAAQARRLAVVRERLGGPGASARAAEWLWSLAA
ncbi:MAG: lipid-A-disaccharide synthase [Candidatus Eisenbacteria bacterium]|uniref:Lipid-A-disaccharide synthase n=1 Tax=Eiseniibacteriota bacterium TaxID=2212470 RepID=A0A9D6QJ35_UNCEI|nr:lipid-A-disaccharide synthase [Candidatus Eisenbacteria bacterium]MBI3540112.1 lipid-A-disaccharide synthase [Candidatus Eisenbacteria bacterium]